MRELFDDAHVPVANDPQEAARRNARPALPKRFYKLAAIAQTDDGFVITLDGKPVRTPSRKPLAAPLKSLAEAMASEWNAQGEFIDPRSMPLTRLANSVIDAVTDRVPDVVEDIAKYFESDLLFYRAGFPEALVAREAEHWDPVMYWAADDLGARFILGEGVVHVAQPGHAVAAARRALPEDPWSVAALHIVTHLTGSALLALALARGRLDASTVWAAAHVDEDWNAESWGRDDEAQKRRGVRHADFEAAAKVLEAVRAERG